LFAKPQALNKEEEIYIKVDESNEEIQLQNFPFEEEEDIHTVHVASRKSKISGVERPLIDTAGDRYASFLDINQKIEVNVFEMEIGEKSLFDHLNTAYSIIRPFQHLKTNVSDCYQSVQVQV
jgi:hypothetical protein